MGKTSNGSVADPKDRKVYVTVSVEFRKDGQMMPRQLVWEDGQKFDIDRVTAVTPAPALRAGGQGDRYTIMVGGRERYIWFERSAEISGANLGRWFVEKRAS